MVEKDKPVVAFKGFTRDWKCRDFQFSMGGSYKHEGSVVLCKSGFHACLAPLDVFNYYSPADSKFAAVELTGVSDETQDEDTKRAAAGITLKAELNIAGLVSAHISYVNANLKKDKVTKRTEQSAASNTGNRSAASNTGNRSAASNTGYQSAASNTGDYSAASNTGNYSAASNTGYQSAASNTGADGVAAAFGLESKAKGGAQSILIVAWHDGQRKRTTVGYVGENGIKPDTWYRANAKGELVEVAA
jgi:hypothetical protein